MAGGALDSAQAATGGGLDDDAPKVTLMKPVAYYKDREQTYLKHFFLERYLEAVAYHIGYSKRSSCTSTAFRDRGVPKTRNSATPRSASPSTG